MRRPRRRSRLDRDLSAKTVFGGLAVTLICMVALYSYFSGTLAGGIVAAVVMLVLGFFFAAVSGNLVGMIGSSNNPISGLTLSTLIVAALLMVVHRRLRRQRRGGGAGRGRRGLRLLAPSPARCCRISRWATFSAARRAACRSATSWAIFVASALLYFPLLVLHKGNINAGGIGFGDNELSAPQAGLMASLAQGIVGGDMPWPLVVVGIFMGFALIMVQVRSPMLFAVGHVSAAGDDLRHFPGRRHPLDHRHAAREAAASTRRRRRASRTPAC